jgi:hypothetical protein
MFIYRLADELDAMLLCYASYSRPTKPIHWKLDHNGIIYFAHAHTNPLAHRWGVVPGISKILLGRRGEERRGEERRP